MFDCTPAKLFELKDQAIKYRDVILTKTNEFALSYMGSNYDGRKPEQPVPENFYVDYVKTAKAKIVYDNPQLDASLLNSGIVRDAVRALEGGLNSLARRRNTWRLLSRVFLDMCINWGIIGTEYVPAREQSADDELVPFEPHNYRISPHRWFCDPECDYYEPADGQCEFAGHTWIAYKNELLEDDRYNRAAIEKLAPDTDLGKYFADGRDRANTDQKRDRIVGYEIWVPNYHVTDDPRAHGTIFTLAETQPRKDAETKKSDDWIRDPRPFYGPADGPYTLFGFLDVPECPYPLSYFASCHEQILELNAHTVAMARAACKRKQVIFVDASETDVPEQIEQAEDMQVIKVKNLAQGALRVETVGGADEAQYRYVDTLLQRAERATGLSSNDRGQISKGSTATAVAESAAMRDDRIAQFKSRFDDSSCMMFRTDAWYMLNMSSSVWPMTPEDALRIEPRSPFLPGEREAEKLAHEHGMDLETVREALRHEPDVAFAGGPADQVRTWVSTEEGSRRLMMAANVGGLTIDDIGLSIQPYSMERVSSAVLQRNVQWLWGVVVQTLPLMSQFPDEIEWQDLLDRMGKPFNIPDLGDLFRVDAIRQRARMQLLQNMAAPAPGSGVGQFSPPQQPLPGAGLGQARMPGFEGDESGNALSMGMEAVA